MNRDISTLHNWQHNPRSISKDNFERLKKQITKLGIYKPLLITEDGTVLGGNMRLKAYKDLGIKEVPVSIVEAPTEEKKIEYALSDNDRAGQYEGDQLADLIGNFPEVEWNDYAVDIKPPLLVHDLMDQYSEVVEDEVPEVSQDPPISKLGEVYTLGRHRLMCGNSTLIEDVEKLMDGKKADMVFTDPPYGIDVVNKDGFIGGGSKIAPVNKFSRVIGDDVKIDVSFLLNNAPKAIIWRGNYFCHYLPKGGHWLVWDKAFTDNEREALTFSECELAWTNIDGVSVKKYKARSAGFSREGESGSRLHPTQKSIIVLSDILRDWSIEGNIVQDLFGGSGSTLIACEQTNRICFMSEIDEKYSDVIRKRYWKFTHDNKEEGWQDGTKAISNNTNKS